MNQEPFLWTGTRRRFFVSLILVFFALSAYAQKNAASDSTVENARGFAKKLIEQMKLPGLAAAVGIDNKIVWSEGFGTADVEHNVSVHPSTIFRVGSVSKPLTAAAIGKLYESGQLKLDAPVQQYVPSFPKKKFSITTRQLAGHLAGIRSYRGDEFLSQHHYRSILESLTIFENDSLNSRPGTRYEYTTYGFTLISAVIEGASKEQYLDYMKEKIFLPLQMKHTLPEFNDSIVTHRARSYMRDSTGRLMNAPYVDNSNKWAGGGYLSTTEDLLRFGVAHLQPGFHKKETLQTLFASQRTNDGTETGYGIGWRLGKDKKGRQTIFHSGTPMGGRAIIMLIPDAKMVIVLLANLNGNFLDKDVLPLTEIFIK
jgi:serine beta-lactamase-like protein LACTB